jgi:hypothetical protein
MWRDATTVLHRVVSLKHRCLTSETRHKEQIKFDTLQVSCSHVLWRPGRQLAALVPDYDYLLILYAAEQLPE